MEFSHGPTPIFSRAFQEQSDLSSVHLVGWLSVDNYKNFLEISGIIRNKKLHAIHSLYLKNADQRNQHFFHKIWKEKWNHKRVLLRERKRHTVGRVSSTRYAGLVEGTPLSGIWPGRGYCPTWTWKGVPPAWAWEGVTPPRTWTWEGGNPHLDLGKGYPHLDLGRGTPPPPPPSGPGKGVAPLWQMWQLTLAYVFVFTVAQGDPKQVQYRGIN